MKRKLKKALHIFFVLTVLPLFVFHRIESLLIGRKKSFQGISQLICLIPGYYGIYFRSAFYSISMKKFHYSAVIEFGTTFSNFNSCIGKGVVTGRSSCIGYVDIGENTLVGGHLNILSGNKQHNFNDINIPIKEQGGMFKKIKIGEDCFIGNGSIIMNHIGSKCVVASGSIVVKEVFDYEIVAGNPAKVIGSRT